MLTDFYQSFAGGLIPPGFLFDTFQPRLNNDALLCKRILRLLAVIPQNILRLLQLLGSLLDLLSCR